MQHHIRKTYTKTLYTMNLQLNMNLDILERYLKDISRKYSSNIPTYMNIY